MSKYVFLGSFPPPFGGVTVKNKMIYDFLNRHIKIEQSMFYKKKCIIFRFFQLIKEIISKNIFVVGLSNKSLLRLSIIFYILNKSKMKKSIVFVMGGTIYNLITNKDVKHLMMYKVIYVEANKIKEELNKLGIHNVSVIPNFRNAGQCIDHKFSRANINIINCIYISNLNKEKGFENIIKLHELIKKSNYRELIKIDLYGHVNQSYEAYINNLSSSIMNYKGIFKSNKENDIYDLMSKYDVLLFPTMWENEGVPGVLIEAKVAGIPAIVSNINFNSEIIENNVDGIVMQDNTGEDLFANIIYLLNNENILAKMKRASLESRKKYLLETYHDKILKDIINYE